MIAASYEPAQPAAAQSEVRVLDRYLEGESAAQQRWAKLAETLDELGYQALAASIANHLCPLA